MVRAIWKNTIIAESEQTRTVEGNYYFPLNSVRQEYLQDSSTTSVCGWKGQANYYSIKVGDDVNNDAAWTYRQPKEEAKEIAGYIAFWKGVQIEV
ncbi:MAG: DUF427 domain-containing protein [Candidatus Obscuribacterales bacterium]|nr:MAG: DUF427 domain-containing protein [Candidatus Melainabacteria bacterium]